MNRGSLPGPGGTREGALRILRPRRGAPLHPGFDQVEQLVGASEADC